MARLRPFLTELFQRAVGVWRREWSFAELALQFERLHGATARSESRGMAPAFGIYHGHAGSGG